MQLVTDRALLAVANLALHFGLWLAAHLRRRQERRQANG